MKPEKHTPPTPATTLAPQIQALITTKGFIEYFWQMSLEYTTQIEAYDATERAHQTHFGSRKYASFESFRINRDRYLRKSRKQKASGRLSTK